MIKWCWTISLSQAFQHRWRIGFQFDYVRCTDTHTNSHAIIRSAYRAWHKKSHSNTNATKYSIVYCNVFSHRISQGVLETWCGVEWICRHVEFVLCTFAWRTRLFFSCVRMWWSRCLLSSSSRWLLCYIMYLLHHLFVFVFSLLYLPTRYTLFDIHTYTPTRTHAHKEREGERDPHIQLQYRIVDWIDG